ncbi:MAG TPA: 30S ribosomal protein S6 [Candidatus Wildermuthbacteria bacterium]|nr:30S ribosomal protein S6 [Candidatus Wildermuthbacteria bacterium]
MNFMKNYELTLILSPLLGEEEMNDLIGTLVSSLQEQGGLLSNQNIGKRTKLAYPIKKQNESNITTLTFTFNPEKLKELEVKLKENTSILRYMLLNKITKVSEIIQKTPQLRPKTDGTNVKADAKEIDEKLKEIFKEATT